MFEPVERCSNWISSSVPETDRISKLAQTFSVDYLVNNITGPILCKEAMQHVPENAVIIGLGPHKLLEKVLDRSIEEDSALIGLLNDNHDSEVEFLLEGLGK